jgi:hypothetical protein
MPRSYVAPIPVYEYQPGWRPTVISRWKVTVNTNYSPKSIAEEVEMTDILGRANDWVWSHPQVGTVYTFRGREVYPEGHEWHDEAFYHDDWIDQTDSKYVVEIGETFKRLHTHVDVETQHRTRLNLDREAIRAQYMHFFRHMGETRIKNVYVNIVAYKDLRQVNYGRRKRDPRALQSRFGTTNLLSINNTTTTTTTQL